MPEAVSIPGDGTQFICDDRGEKSCMKRILAQNHEEAYQKFK
jgi:hypothetical protein